MKLDVIEITVKDMAESIRFYRLLGWDIPDPEPGEPHHEAMLPNGLRLALDDLKMIKEIDEHWTEPAGQRMTLAFLCDSVQEVDGTYAKVKEAGFKAHREPWDAFWGQRYAQIADPDGNVVDLFCWLPTS